MKNSFFTLVCLLKYSFLKTFSLKPLYNLGNIGLLGLLLVLSSCQKSILQQPGTTGLVDINTVFLNANNALSMLMENYRNTLVLGWGQNGIGFASGCLGSYSGELSIAYSWEGPFGYAATGPSSLAGNNSKSGDAFSVADFASFYPNIRANFIVIENIDRVPNMTIAQKEGVKAEAYGLIAYTYLHMFKNYGGVPIVTHSFLPTDNVAIPRATLQETYDYIVQLCDTSINTLSNVVYTSAQNGRLTAGAVMAIKAQAAIFAARPLFNSTQPYLPNLGSKSNLICFGNADPNRWNDVINYTNDALSWAQASNIDIINTGGVAPNTPNPNAFKDYATATSTPSNSELLLAYHVDETGEAFYYNMSNYWLTSRYDNELTGLLRGQLVNYYKSDGTEQSWPKQGDASPRPASDYFTRFRQMEPRFQADFVGPGLSSANNPSDPNWSDIGWGGVPMFNVVQNFPSGTYGRGCAIQTKFFYNAGNRIWFEYPLIRAAELYLNLAEAYNESGDPSDALINLNKVHNRAGLPAITETDQTKLRIIIQREWAVEFFNESKRFYDGRHWKISNGNGIMYGPQQEFQFSCLQTAGTSLNLPTNLINYWSAVSFNAYWNPKMFLEPFPLTEVNKGVIVQNPGY